MSSDPTFTTVQDLLPLYAIGALDPDDMRFVAAYLERHRDLLRELETLEETVALLALSAEDVPLPTDARARLLARVHADQAGQAAPTLPNDARARLLARVQADQAPAAPPAPIIPQLALRRPNQFWRLSSIVAVAALLLLALYTGVLRGGLNQAQTAVAVLETENQRLQTALEQRREQLALLSSAERSVRLDSTTDDADASATFSLSGNTGVYLVRGLAPLPADRTYQLWLVPPNGTPTAIGLLTVADNGEVSGTVQVPPALRNFTIVDVSIEPAGGSAEITKETIVLRGTTS